ncbi:MAG: PilZ domain-containing protein [Pseudomonadota bacterium]
MSHEAEQLTEREMRRSFRIREHAFIRVRVLDDAEFAAIIESRSLRRPSAFGDHARLVQLESQFQEAFTLLGNAPQSVRRCLETLNAKLNLLVDAQPERKSLIRELTEGEALTCEIGASGVRFDHDEPLPEGARLFLQVLLTSDRHYLETAATVRRCPHPLNDDATRPHGIAAEFVGFSEAESELLIKHLFQRESESLRMRRLNADDD